MNLQGANFHINISENKLQFKISLNFRLNNFEVLKRCARPEFEAAQFTFE